MPASWLSSIGSFLGSTGCVWLRMKAIFSVLVLIPLAIVIIYFVATIKTETAYTVVGTVKTVSANAAIVEYTDPSTNLPVTKSIDITPLVLNSTTAPKQTSTTTASIAVGSPVTLYVDKKNSSVVSVQQPFTPKLKILVITGLSFVLCLFCFEVVTAFYNKQLCQAVGGAELVGDALS